MTTIEATPDNGADLHVSQSTAEDREVLKQAAAEFTRREIFPHMQEWEDAGALPRDLHRKAAEAGLMGIGFPERVGGDGGGLLDTIAVQEGMFSEGATSGLMSALFTHGIACPHIAAHGSDHLVDTYVRPTLRGELIGSLGITEPGGGSDVGNLRTTAVRGTAADGSQYWLINGTKTFITSATRADFITVAARTGGAGANGISMIVVPTDTPGFQVDRKLAKMGWHSSDTGEISFTDVRVPIENLVGDENAGFWYIAEQFVVERMALAVHGYGIAERSLNLTVEYCRQRDTFGKPLITRQVVRHKLVEMRRQVEAAKAYTHLVGHLYTEAGGPDEAVIAQACLAKETACNAATYVCDQAVQLHGGTGYMHGTEVERHYRDARLLPIGGGATEVLTDLAAKLLGYAS